MKEYVAGFLFDEDRRHVLLILKNRPDWQKGRWNGIGGRIEDGETPLGAMRREFTEETGLIVNDWNKFAVLTDARGWAISFFWAIGDVWAAQQVTDEVPRAFDLCSDDLRGINLINIIPNLRWLIPMALSMPLERCEQFVVEERAA